MFIISWENRLKKEVKHLHSQQQQQQQQQNPKTHSPWIDLPCVEWDGERIVHKNAVLKQGWFVTWMVCHQAFHCINCNITNNTSTVTVYNNILTVRNCKKGWQITSDLPGLLSFTTNHSFSEPSCSSMKMSIYKLVQNCLYGIWESESKS